MGHSDIARVQGSQQQSCLLLCFGGSCRVFQTVVMRHLFPVGSSTGNEWKTWSKVKLWHIPFPPRVVIYRPKEREMYHGDPEMYHGDPKEREMYHGDPN